MGSYIKQRQPVEGESIMGLERFGYVMFPDSKTEIEIPFVNNKFRLGSDPTTKFGLTPKQQEEYEHYFGVQFDSPEGKDFLANYRIEISHLVNPFDEAKIEHRFMASILKANDGMGLVDTGTNQDNTLYPFVLVDEEKEVEQKVNRNNTRNEAISELQKLKKDGKKMIKIAKYLFNLNLTITEDQAYIQLNDFILNSFKDSEEFLKVLNVDLEWLDTTVAVKDAMNCGIIRKGDDQVYINFANQAKLGRTIEEVTKFLNNPDNQDILGTGGKNDAPYSIKAQLKNKIA